MSDQQHHVEFSRDELVWVNNALNEVLHGPDAINESEFGVRMGGSRGEVKALLHRISDLLR